MNSFLVAFSILLFSPPVHAEYSPKIIQYCRNQNDLESCLRAHKELPPINTFPGFKKSPAYGPISIEVVPFSENSSDRYSSSQMNESDLAPYLSNPNHGSNRIRKAKRRRLNARPWDRDSWNNLIDD